MNTQKNEKYSTFEKIPMIEMSSDTNHQDNGKLSNTNFISVTEEGLNNDYNKQILPKKSPYTSDISHTLLDILNNLSICIIIVSNIL